jgi:formylmethanofuran dehydrogenase subunit B
MPGNTTSHSTQSHPKLDPLSPNIVCTGCSLLCNDIRWRSGDSSFAFPVECRKGRAHLSDTARSSGGASDVPGDGESYHRDLAYLAGRLASADLPLICGLADQPDEAIEKALELARLVSAAIDWTGGFEPAAWHFALQQEGRVSCSVAEMQNHADLIVVWNADPVTTHPRLLEGVTADVIFIGVAENATSARARQFSICSRASQIAALREIRETIGGTSVPARAATGDLAAGLLDSLRNAAYPVIILDDGFAEQLGNVGVVSLNRLVHELNQVGECRLLHVSRQTNRRGAEHCFLSLTGSPFGVVFREGSPLFRGRDAAAEVLIRRKETDFVLAVSDSLEPDLDEALRTGGIPFATIGQLSGGSSLHIPAGRWGLESGGAGLACDGSSRSAQATSDKRTGGSADVLCDLIQKVLDRGT